MKAALLSGMMPALLATLLFAAPPVFAERITVTVEVTPGERDWQNAPVRVDLRPALSAAGCTTPVMAHMVRVQDPDGREVPSRLAWSERGEEPGVLLFTKQGVGAQVFTVLIDTDAPWVEGRPVPTVGMGEPLSYGETGVVTGIDGSYNSNLAVGDFDGDGDVDLIMQGGDGRGWTYHGTQFYRNIASQPGAPLMVGEGQLPIPSGHPRVVDWDGDGKADFIIGATLYRNTGEGFPMTAAGETVEMPALRGGRVYADWNGDGLFDIIESYSYGGGRPSRATWSMEDCDTSSPYTSEGVWRGYEDHGVARLWRNVGEPGAPRFVAEPETLLAAGQILDVPSGGNPAVGDIDGDGDADLLMGNRFDLYWFENTGTAAEPVLARGRPLNLGLADIYIRPVVADVDGDGDMDVVFGNEGGDARWLENTGRRTPGGCPDLLATKPLLQRDPFIDAGSVGAFDIADLNGDEKPDVILGNSYGEVWLALSRADSGPWVFNAARRVSAGTSLIRVFAGASGSIQGPEEAHYGYVAPEIADWDQDGVADLILHDVWGKFRLYRGLRITSEGPVFDTEQPLRFARPGDATKPAWTWWDPVDGELVTQWRCRAEVLDWNGDGTNDLTAMDHRGFLALYQGTTTERGTYLLPPEYVFTDEEGRPILLNDGCHGRSGRRKHMFADWDRDGDLDMVRNMASPAMNHQIHPEESGLAAYYENLGNGRFALRGEMVPDTPPLAGHGTCPQMYDFDGDGWLDLLVGGECGHIFVFHRAYIEQDLPTVTCEVAE